MILPISDSIVSHGDGIIVSNLIDDLLECPEIESIILTRNIPEPALGIFANKKLIIIENSHPKGFGANHNFAFKHIRTPYFAVLNPDIRIKENPFPALIDCLGTSGTALCAPIVLNPAGNLEDSARHFPTPYSLFLKALKINNGTLKSNQTRHTGSAPWVAGMFMCFRSMDFSKINGFDEAFFLYYEDVDLCARLWKNGFKVKLCSSAHVIHD
ncbi:MAG: glycosyltransferase family 2 protein, partial [bacterium]